MNMLYPKQTVHTVLSVCCQCIYLVFEAVYRNHIHHDDIICKRLEARQTDAAVWKHSPETNKSYGGEWFKCLCEIL